jgi:hypothetical protein
MYWNILFNTGLQIGCRRSVFGVRPQWPGGEALPQYLKTD